MKPKVIKLSKEAFLRLKETRDKKVKEVEALGLKESVYNLNRYGGVKLQ